MPHSSVFSGPVSNGPISNGPILKVRGVQKSYRLADNNVPVLRDVQLDIHAGETLAILGPSGSGKSTLLSLLAGLDQPDQGTIELLNTDLTQLDERQLTAFRAAHMAIVFQQFHLLAHLRAIENVALPLRIAGDAQAFAKARSALAQVKLDHRSDHLPHQLSGGENQRLAIARALIVKPKLLFADEPSGNLDTRTGEQVMRLLFDLVAAEGTSLVLVTHNEELAASCSRRLYLSNGCLQHERPA